MTVTQEAPAVSAGDAYHEALLSMCQANRDFAAFLEARAALSYSNAAEYEARAGKLAHKDRAAASEVQYILQQFRRSLL